MWEELRWRMKGCVANRNGRRTEPHQPPALGGEHIELFGERGLMAHSDFHLPFLDHGHDFDAC